MARCGSSSLPTAKQVADKVVDSEPAVFDEEDYDRNETFGPGSDVEFDDFSDQEEEDEEDLESPTKITSMCTDPSVQTDDASRHTDSDSYSNPLNDVGKSLKDMVWSSSVRKVEVRPFEQAVGPTVLIPADPLKVFMLFFTPKLLQTITDQTNLYAAQSMGEDTHQQWTRVTVEEIKAYFGFMILMGIVKLPSLADYWKTDEIFHYTPVAKRITRDRFTAISRYLHFTDNTTLASPGSDNYDKIGKVKPIVEYVRNRFLSVYNPSREVAIDEAMVPFKGRSTIKQHMPKKPVKRGIKIWARADSNNGYISDFSVYTGKEGNKTERNLGGNVVTRLTQGLERKGYHLYFDNFFTSVSLLINLWKRGLYACGTLRKEREGFPADLKQKATKGFTSRGDSESRQFQNVTVTVWQDSRPVVIASTNSDPTTAATVTRKDKDGKELEVASPSSVASYNKYMGGVDRNDQLRTYYHVRLKCRKFYKYIFWFLFDVSVTNALILCKHFTDLKIKNVKDFRVSLAMSLIGDYCSRKRLGRPPKQPVRKRFCQDHFPKRGAEKPHRCHYCHNTKKRRRSTVWYCNECKMFLCHTGKGDDCFYEYHTKHGPFQPEP